MSGAESPVRGTLRAVGRRTRGPAAGHPSWEKRHHERHENQTSRRGQPDSGDLPGHVALELRLRAIGGIRIGGERAQTGAKTRVEQTGKDGPGGPWGFRSSRGHDGERFRVGERERWDVRAANLMPSPPAAPRTIPQPPPTPPAHQAREQSASFGAIACFKLCPYRFPWHRFRAPLQTAAPRRDLTCPAFRSAEYHGLGHLRSEDAEDVTWNVSAFSHGSAGSRRRPIRKACALAPDAGAQGVVGEGR